MTLATHKRFVAKMKAGGRITRPFNYKGRIPRHDMALTLQESGLSYNQIAKKMGLTFEGARAAVRYAKLRWRLPGGHA